MNRFMVAVIGITVLLAGCGTQAHIDKAQSMPPASTSSPTSRVIKDSAAPPCTAAQLSAADGGNQGGGTQIQAYIKITNIGASACVLSGVPPALALVGDGTVLSSRTVPTDSVHLVKRAQLLRPHAANAAYLVVWWGNWCGSANERANLRITLPNARGTLQSSLNSHGGHEFVPECLQQGAPSTLQVTAAYFSQQ